MKFKKDNITIPPLLIVITFLSVIVTLLFAFLSYNSFRGLQLSEENRYQTFVLGEQVRLRFEKTTSASRSYAVSGDTKYLKMYYLQILRSIEGKEARDIEKGDSSLAQIAKYVMNNFTSEQSTNDRHEKLKIKLKGMGFMPEEVHLLNASNKLVQLQFSLEALSFSYVDAGRKIDGDYSRTIERERALDTLFSEQYIKVKSDLDDIINHFLDSAYKRNNKNISKTKEAVNITTALAVFFCIILLILLVYILFSNQKSKKYFVSTLRKEVSNRTMDLFEKREKLKAVINEMEETKSQLVESEKMASLGNLVSGVAHEVNTPLGISVTLGSHLQEETKILLANVESGKLKRSDLDIYCAEAIENCTLLLSNLDRAANLISSFKQVAVDQSSDEVRTFKISEYMDEVLLSLHPRIKKTSIVVTVDVPNDEPFLTTYPGAIAQIVTNLVMNALIHAFNHYQDKGNINFLLRVEGEDMLIDVSDDGKGMRPNVVSQIFEPFFTTERGSGGSGLGLSIVYNLVVHQLKGTIKCKSVLQQGTTFFIRFPMHAKNNESRGI